MGPWRMELCSDVRPAAVEWLWPGYLARGKLAVLDGDPDVGKSMLTIDLAARLSRGGPLPDGGSAPRPTTNPCLPQPVGGQAANLSAREPLRK